MLLWLLFAALYVKSPDVYVAAWAMGIVRDVYSQDPIGLHALIYVAVCVVVCRLRTEIFRDHLATRVFATAMAAFGLGALDLALTFVAHPHVDGSVALRKAVLWAGYTTLVCPVVYTLFDVPRWLARGRARRWIRTPLARVASPRRGGDGRGGP